MSLPAPPINGQRIVHPDWCGARRVGEVVAVVNAYHADVWLYGMDHTVRAAIARLEPDLPAPAPASGVAEDETSPGPQGGPHL